VSRSRFYRFRPSKRQARAPREAPLRCPRCGAECAQWWREERVAVLCTSGCEPFEVTPPRAIPSDHTGQVPGEE